MAIHLNRASDRSGRFLARLDRELRALADDDARAAFLDRQLARWEGRYARFIASAGASEPLVDPAEAPQAADFLITIVALAARRLRLRRQPPSATCSAHPRASGGRDLTRDVPRKTGSPLARE
jgi:hypothetical protein